VIIFHLFALHFFDIFFSPVTKSGLKCSKNPLDFQNLLPTSFFFIWGLTELNRDAISPLRLCDGNRKVAEIAAQKKRAKKRVDCD
jgi:hypothetical protein